jgi:hypothetical protein
LIDSFIHFHYVLLVRSTTYYFLRSQTDLVADGSGIEGINHQNFVPMVAKATGSDASDDLRADTSALKLYKVFNLATGVVNDRQKNNKDVQ